MKYRKLFILILSMLTMITVLPRNSWRVEAGTEINVINLYGVKEVKAGEKATVSGIYVASGSNYHLDEGKSNWYNESDLVVMREGDVFEYNKMYTLRAYFVPDSGYSFAAVPYMEFHFYPEISSDKYRASVTSYGSQQLNRVAYVTFNTNRDKYNVSFDGNGGIGEMESFTAYHDDYYRLPVCEFMAPGAHLEFDGWQQGDVNRYIRIKSDTVIKAEWKVREGYTGIDYIEIVPGKLPAVGDKNEITGWGSGEPDKYEFTGMAFWTNVTDHLYLDKEDNFMAAKQYSIDMMFDAMGTYYFEEFPEITLKGIDKSVYTVTGEVRNYSSSMYITITFNPLPGYDLLRLSGSNRFGTSMAIADYYRKGQGISQHNCIILACSDNFADALAGSYLANALNAPILIINDSKAKEVEDYIKAKLAPTGGVIILGGEKAVSKKIENDLTGMGIPVERLAGSNRYGTNIEILKRAGILVNILMVATGTNFADSLSASAVGFPILLVGNSLTQDQKDFLNAVTWADIFILGGTGAVSESIENEISAFGKVKRVSGENRYQTSLKIADEFFYKPGMVILANGDKFPDGLCAGPVGSRFGAPLILIKDGKIEYAHRYAEGRGLKRGIVAGGTAVISDKSFRDVFTLDKTAVIRENN